MTRYREFLYISVLCALMICAERAQAQSDTTTFNYQAELNQNGQPVNGWVNLDFSLFDAAVGGNQLGSEIMFNSFPIVDDRFTVDLDFGDGIFNGDPRFLQVSVNGNELVPRQRINSAPYAIQSDNTRGLFVDDNNRVGIGTETPGIAEPSIIFDVEGGSIRAANSGDQADLLWLASDRSWVFRQEGTGATTALKLQSIGGGGNKNFVVQTDGFVGIGTNSPAAKLHVAGGALISSDALITGRVGIGTVFPTVKLHVVAADFQTAMQVTNNGSFGAGDGVRAEAILPAGRAIVGLNFNGGKAGFFSGNVQVSGNLSKSSGSFKIDHPLDPANKYLYHSFVESPDMMNIYNGNVITDERGFASIEMPDWFEALNREFRYQLTVIDEENGDDFVLAKVVEEIQGNQFRIRTSAPATKVSWQVTGVRQDAWAEAHRIPVEEDKVGHEFGHYQHPEVFGLDQSLSVESARQAMIDEQQEVDSDRSEFESNDLK